MGYGVGEIEDYISGTATATPLLETGGTYLGYTYKDPDLTNWWWQPEGSADPDLPLETPGGSGGFQYRAYMPTAEIPGGVSTSTPIMTFAESGRPRILSFRTKISGEFTFTFKIIAGGNVPNTDIGHLSAIRKSNNAAGNFENPNGAWASTTIFDRVKVAYNTTSYEEGTGTWVEVNSMHAYWARSDENFNNQQFHSFTVTFTLPAEAYVGILTVGTRISNYEYWALADVQLTYVDSEVVAGYNSISVTNFTSHWNEMQRMLNGGILTSDISTTPWVETYHMKPMRFFGSPAPRVEAISGDIHHRFERTTSMLYKGQGEVFMPIHGLATTIHVAPPFLDQTVTALVRCNFFAEESDNEGSFAAEYKDLCDFGLFVIQGNGVAQFISGSLRNLYQEKDGTNIGKKNISIINRVTLSVGINHVYVGIRFAENDSGRGRAHISRKVFVVDVKYI